MKRILCMLLALTMLFLISFEVVATGSNGAKMNTKWNDNGTLTLTIISNGEVRITIES